MDDEVLQKCLQAGKIASRVRREAAARAVDGAVCVDLMDYCERRIRELGGQIAWAQMAINDVAAHYCPEEDDSTRLKEGDLVKVDIGVHLDGFIADNAMTVQVGGSHDLIKASQRALKAAIKLVRPGTALWQLGEAQFSEAEKMGFTTIKNLCGHTLGRYKVHDGISIPTYNTHEKTELQEGWQIALEPFVTDGQGMIKEKGKATVFMVENSRSTRSVYGKKILQQVAFQKGLPFTTRWLSRSMGKGAAALGLRDLLQEKIIHAYHPLAEISGRRIAQFEHSMIVRDKPLVYTRHEDDEW